MEIKKNWHKFRYEYIQGKFNELSSECGFYAFSQKQFREGLEQYQVTPADLEQRPIQYFLLKEKAEHYDETSAALDAEIAEYISDFGNLKEAFKFELKNHEICYCFDVSEAIQDVLAEFGLKSKTMTAEQYECFRQTMNEVMLESEC